MNNAQKRNDAAIYFLLPSALKTAAEYAADAEHITLAAWLRKIMEQHTTPTRPNA